VENNVVGVESPYCIYNFFEGLELHSSRNLILVAVLLHSHENKTFMVEILFASHHLRAKKIHSVVVAGFTVWRWWRTSMFCCGLNRFL
jgi:hypothetical protein